MILDRPAVRTPHYSTDSIEALGYSATALVYQRERSQCGELDNLCLAIGGSRPWRPSRNLTKPT